eukprot:3681948-Rhodomonas_salina.1
MYVHLYRCKVEPGFMCAGPIDRKSSCKPVRCAPAFPVSRSPFAVLRLPCHTYVSHALCLRVCLRVHARIPCLLAHLHCTPYAYPACSPAFHAFPV